MFRLAVHLVLSYSSEEIVAYLKNEEFRKGGVFEIAATRSDSLAAALSLQADAYPIDLTATDGLVTDIVNRLDKHPHWRAISPVHRLEAFRTLLKMISSRLMLNAHSIYPVNRLESRSEFVSSKAITIFSITTLSNRLFRNVQMGNTTPSGVGLFPTASWFNHSCRANVNSL